MVLALPMNDNTYQKIPQIGNVVIENNVEIELM